MPYTFKIHDYKDEAGNDVCIGGPLLNADYVNAMLGSAGSQDVVFDISSIGGSVWDGIAMYDAIKKSGRADTRIGALAASSASIIAMAGRKVTMSKYGLLMIHKPMVGSGGNADDLLNDVNMLNTIQSRIAQIYMDKTGLDAITINSLINSVTWMTADQALDLGFIDAIEDYAVEATNHALIKPFISSSAAVYQKVFNKLTIETDEEMKTEDKELIEKNIGLMGSVMNFFKSFTQKTVTNKGAVNSLGPVAIGSKVTNEDGTDMEDGDYEVDNAFGKKAKMTVKDSIVTAMEDNEPENVAETDEEKATNAVLNTHGLKVSNKVEAAGFAKVITNHVNTINTQNALIDDLKNQLAVSNAAVERDETAIRATIQSEFEPQGSRRSDTTQTNAANDLFKPTGSVAQNAVKRALNKAPGIVQ